MQFRQMAQVIKMIRRLWNALTTTPVIPVYDENGNYVHNHDEAFKILENPVSIAKTRTDITYTNRILSSAFADIEVFKGT